MICKKYDCKANKSGYHNNCMALKDGAESQNCPFYKTREVFEKEIDKLVKDGHLSFKNTEEYECFEYNKYKDYITSKA